MSKVSVILTSYNHASYLNESIDSILNQTYLDFELVIVDDCSVDNSWDIICSYQDTRIRAIKHEKNIGDCLTKELIRSLKGEYIAIAHCDDKWKEDKLEKQVDYLNKNMDVFACFTQVQLLDEKSEYFTDENHYYYKTFEQENRTKWEWLHYFFYHGNCLCHPSLMIRKEEYLEYDLFTVGLYSIPDFYKWVKLCFHKEIYIYPERLSYFRIRVKEDNTSSDTDVNRKRMRFEELKVLDVYEEFLSFENIMKIFPHSDSYLISGEMNVPFAFAKLLMAEKNRKTYQLRGLDILYKLINNKASANEIERLYQYRSKAFREESSVPDIFHEIKNEDIMSSTLYFDIGNGFNENDSFKKEVFINAMGYCRVLYDFENDQFNGSLRFDPDEGVFRDFSEVCIFVNEQEIKYKTNAHHEDVNWLYFYTTDPTFIFDVPKVKKYRIEIYAKVKLADLSLIDIYIKHLQMNQKKKFLYKR